MAETVDTRVVEARFDSKQFEQGVDRTVKKLDELKKSLNLKNTEKSVAEIGNKISETSEKASNSLEKLEERFTSFAGMLKQKILSGIGDEIVGVFFKIENGVKSLITSLSSAQIGAGMQRYTDILTSVRTLTAAGVEQSTAYVEIERLGEYADQTSYSLDELVSTMAKFKTAGADIDTARRMVEGLSNAAASMGVNAQQAGRAYLNMQQAYSKGVMLSEDWRSFEALPMVGTKFNQMILDAAASVGTLKKEANGTYTAVAKAIKATGGSGYGSRSGVSGLGKGITAENMGSKLGSRFFTKKVMEEVFGNMYYFDVIDPKELNKIKAKERELKKLNLTQEEYNKEFQDYLNTYSEGLKADYEKEYNEKLKELEDNLASGAISQDEYKKSITSLKKELDDFNKSHVLTVAGYEALRAGQEARSLNDVLLTLRDTISRGWAKSFELIFGKLDEAGDFFTKLTESNLANAIYSIGDIRNAILEIWASPGANGGPSGRDNILKGLETMDDLLGSVFEQMGLIRKERVYFDQNYYESLLGKDGSGTAAAEAYKQQMERMQKQWDDYVENAPEPFEEFVNRISHTLMMLSRDIRIIIERIRDFFTTDLVFGETRLQRIANVIKGVGEAINIVFNALFDLKARVIDPLASSLFTNLEKILQPFYELINPDIKNENGYNIYNKSAEGIENVISLAEKFVEKVTPVLDILGDILKFIVEMSAGSVYMNIEFFADALGLVNELLFGQSAQKKTNYDQRLKELDTALKTGTISAKEYADKIKEIEETGGKGVLDGIRESFVEIGDTIKNISGTVFGFFESLIRDFRIIIGLDEGELTEGGLFSNLKNFFENNEFLKNVKSKFDEISSKVLEFAKELPSKIIEALTSIPAKISDFFSGSDEELNDENNREFEKRYLELLNGGMDLEDADKIMDEWKKRALRQQWRASLGDGVTGVLAGWYDTVKYAVIDFINDIPNKVAGIPSLIGEFFNGMLYQQDGTPTAFKAWFDQAKKDVEEFIASIPGHLANIPNVISKFLEYLFGSEKTVWTIKDGKKQSYKIKGIFRDWLDQAIIDAKNFIKDIPKKLERIPSIVESFFKKLFYTPVTISGVGTTWVEKPLTAWVDKNIVQNLKTFVANLPTYIGQAIGTVANFFGKVFSVLFGTEYNPEETTASIQDALEKPFLGIDLISILERIKDIGRKIINGVLSIFTGKTDWEENKNLLAEGVGKLVDGLKLKIDEAWTNIEKFFNDLPGNIEAFFNNSAKETEKGGTIETAASGFLKGLEDWISKIPSVLLNAWKGAEALSVGLYETILGWITGDEKVGQLNSKYQKRYDEQMEKGLKNFSTEAQQDVYNSLFKEQWREDNPAAANINDFFGNLIEYLKEKIINLPTDIANGVNDLLGILNGLLTTVTEDWFKDDSENAAKSINDQNGEKSLFLEAISNLGSTIAKFITETLPGFIREGILYIGEHAEEWANSFVGLFNGGERTAKEEIDKFGETIKGFFSSAFRGETFDESFYKDLLNQEDEQIKKAKDKFGEDFDLVPNFAELYKQETKNPILEFFRGIVSGIGSIFETVGPTILDGINTAINWVGGKLGEISTWITEETTNDNGEKLSFIELLDKKFTDPETGKTSELWEKIKEVGRSIRDFMIVTIPDFIRAAVKKISEEIPNILSGLFDGSLFKGSSKNTTKTDTAVTEDAKVQIEKQVNGSHPIPYLEYIIEALTQRRALLEDALKFGEKQAEDNSQNFLEGLMGMLITSAKADGSAVEEWTDFLLNNGNSLGIDGGVITLDMKNKQEEKYAKDAEEKLQINRKKRIQEIKDSINQIDSQISNIAPADRLASRKSEFEALRKEQDSLAEELIGLEKSKDEFVKSAGSDDKAKTEKAIFSLDGLGSFADKMVEVFGKITSIAENGGAQIVLALVGITLILHQLNDLISVRDTISEAGYSAKWIGIAIAITGIAGILGYITYLASIDDKDNDKFEKVKGVFEHLGSFIKDMAGIIEDIVVISTIGSGLEAVGDVAEAIGKKKEGKGILATLLTQLTTFVGVTAGSELLSMGIEKIFQSIADSFGTFAVGIDEFIQTIRPAVEDLSSIYGDAQTALLVIPLVHDLITQIDSLFADKTLTDPHGIKYKGGEGPDIKEIVQNLTGKQQFFYALGVMMSSMTAGLKDFSTIEAPEKELKRFNDFLEGEDGEFSRFMNNVVTAAYIIYDTGLNKMGDIDNKESTLANVITVMSGLFSLLGSSIKDFDKGSIDDLSKFFELLNALAGGNFNGNGEIKLNSLLDKHDKLAKMGMDLQKFGGNMKRFFEKANDIRNILKGEDEIIDQNEEDTFNKTFEFIKTVSEKMMTVANIADQHFVATDFEYVGKSLPEFGLHIMEFINTINSFKPDETINFEFLDSIMSLVVKIKDAIGIATQYFNFKDVPENLEYVAKALVGVFPEDTVFEETGAIEKGFQRVGGLFSTLTDALNSGQYNLNDIEQTIDILAKLSESLRTFFEVDEFGDFKYQSALENIRDFDWDSILDSNFTKPEITPVLFISNDFKEKAKEMRTMLGFDTLNDQYDSNGTLLSSRLQFDPSSLEIPKPIDYSSDLHSLKLYMNAVVSNTGNFVSAMNNLRIDMNGETVGHIVAPYVSAAQGRDILSNIRWNFTTGVPEIAED